jgi:CCR4-NOT transcriptional regulation complex NOT5 subunit
MAFRVVVPLEADRASSTSPSESRNPMKHLIIVLALAAAAGTACARSSHAAPASAADAANGAATQPGTPQRTRMKTCNADAKAKSLSGDERSAFMKNCLSASGTAATPHKELTPQQQKMSTCSKDAKAKGLKGDERKSFMSTCLKG